VLQDKEEARCNALASQLVRVIQIMALLLVDDYLAPTEVSFGSEGRDIPGASTGPDANLESVSVGTNLIAVNSPDAEAV